MWCRETGRLDLARLPFLDVKNLHGGVHYFFGQTLDTCDVVVLSREGLMFECSRMMATELGKFLSYLMAPQNPSHWHSVNSTSHFTVAKAGGRFTAQNTDSLERHGRLVLIRSTAKAGGLACPHCCVSEHRRCFSVQVHTVLVPDPQRSKKALSLCLLVPARIQTQNSR